MLKLNIGFRKLIILILIILILILILKSKRKKEMVRWIEFLLNKYKSTADFCQRINFSHSNRWIRR